MKTLLFVIFIAAFCGNAASPGNVTPARSIMHCGSFCSRLSACQSFFFVAGEQASECQLHNSVYLNSSTMVQTPNVTYYIPANYSLMTLECHQNNGEYHTVQLSNETTFTYKFHQGFTDYSKAVSICANETGRLVKVTTNAKLDMLRKLLLCPDFPTSTVYYIDGVYDGTNATWYFEDSNLATFPDPFWAINHPGNPNVNECLGLEETSSWLARTVKCNRNAAFICEY